MRKFANTHKILVNYPPDSAVPLKTPYFVGARTQVRRYIFEVYNILIIA